MPLAGPNTCSHRCDSSRASLNIQQCGWGGKNGHLLQPPLSLAINVMGEEDGGWILIFSPVSTAPSPSNGAAHMPGMQKTLRFGRHSIN